MSSLNSKHVARTCSPTCHKRTRERTRFKTQKLGLHYIVNLNYPANKNWSKVDAQGILLSSLFR